MPTYSKYLFTFTSGPDFSKIKSHRGSYTREGADDFADGLRAAGATNIGYSVEVEAKATKKPSINATIKHLGVKVVAARCGSRYLGYSYFVSLKTGQQVGDSVMVYRQSQFNHDQWIDAAKAAVKKGGVV